MILSLFRSKPADPAESIYAAIVAQARQPVLYRELGVPDTVEGRYELLMLHAFLYLHRIRDQPAARPIGQAVFDLMFRDMDHTLRQMGVGDLSVPKKIQKMAGLFYGRIAAYEAALAGPPEALADLLAEKIFEGSGMAAEQGRALAAYARDLVGRLAAIGDDDITAAGFSFPPAAPAQG